MNRKMNSADIWIGSQRRSLMTRWLFWCKRWRSGIIRIAEKFVVGDSISNRVIQDISSLSRIQTARIKIASVLLLEDASLIRRDFQGGAETFPLFSDSRRAIFRYVIRDAVVHIPSGVANIAGGFLVEELFGHYAGIFGGGSVAHEYMLTTKSVNTINGTWAVLPTPTNYFHFIAQSLPTLIRSLQSEGIHGVLASNKNMPSWGREALEALGCEVKYLSEETVCIENYVCSSVPQVTSLSDVQILRHAFSKSLSKTSLGLAFVGRGNLHRNLGPLEVEIAEYLTSKGATSNDPSTLDWEAELGYYSSKRNFVMVSGSAMANIVWMQPGTKVLILFDAQRFSTQIEKSLISSSGVRLIEFDTHGLTFLDSKLLDALDNFLLTP